MLIEKQREQEQAERQGNTARTLIMLVWLGIGFVVAYFAANYLFGEKIITPQMFYSLGLPNAIPEIGIKFFLMFLIVVLFQMILIFGFAMGDSGGRRRSGKATRHSTRYDPLDNNYSR